jgi:hypothetical protein
MVKFSATILKFAQQGEKTGWTYIEVPSKISEQIKPGCRKSFRVKGKIDAFAIQGIALLPMGGGAFIMPLNAEMRKGIRKQKGASVTMHLEADDAFSLSLPPDLMECLQEEATAMSFFKTLPKGHQSYFIKWVLSAKTQETQARRMAQMITALAKQQDFGTMMRSLKQNRSDIK